MAGFNGIKIVVRLNRECDGHEAIKATRVPGSIVVLCPVVHGLHLYERFFDTRPDTSFRFVIIVTRECDFRPPGCLSGGS